MTAISRSKGWSIYYDTKTNKWVYSDNKINVINDRPCKYCGRLSKVIEMCDCHSYNLNTGEAGVEILSLPDNVDTGRKNRTVCIDACIVDTIKYLWKNGIKTLGCCCGHNKDNPSIVIESGYKDLDVSTIKEIISYVDKRDWDIFQWRLTKVD